MEWVIRKDHTYIQNNKDFDPWGTPSGKSKYSFSCVLCFLFLRKPEISLTELEINPYASNFANNKYGMVGIQAPWISLK